MQNELVFTEEEWNAVAPTVAREMTAFLRQYRTPIFKDHGDHGEGWGSGSYIALNDKSRILTNEHVANVRRGGQALTHMFLDDERICRIIGDHAEFPLPFDLAVLPVNSEAWAAVPHASQAITLDQIALAHDPVPSELLVFTGFSGEATQFHFNTLHTEGTCYTAREVQLPGDDPQFSRRYHFGMDYRPDLAIKLDERSRGLPVPPGLSGSTVWDTRFVAAKIAGVTWKPDLARVTGVIWGWPSSYGFLVATRAEYVRSFLLAVLQTPV